MEEKNQNIDLRSDEFREILSKPPHALVLYGTAVVCFILTMLLAGSFVFYYPVIIRGEAVITAEAGNYTASILIPMKNAGRVKPGQQVSIRITAYPHQEYGMIRGKVKTVGTEEQIDFATVEAEIPQNMKTSTGFVIEFNHKISGTAEIITEKKRFIEKIFPPAKIFFKKNE